MVSIRLVDPSGLPGRMPVIAVHHPNDLIFIARSDATAEQLARWIGNLGAHVTREAIDATINRSKTATE